MNPAASIAAALLALLVGLGVGYLALAKSDEAAEDAMTLKDELDGLQARVAELETANETLEKENAEITLAKSTLEERVAALDEELADALEAAIEEEAALDPELRRALAVAFGDHADIDALLDADWEKVAGALLTIGEAVSGLAETLDAGEAPDQAQQIALIKENQKLVELAVALVGELPTHGMPGNGEFTHPLALSNMMAEVLAQKDSPLSPQQIAELGVYGEEYESEWARLSESYPEGTTKLEKMLDEIALKQEFVTRADGALTQQQSDYLFSDNVRGRAQLDLYSPALMMIQTARPVAVSSVDELKPKLMERAASFLGVDQETIGQYSGVFDDWVADVRDSMKPIKPTQVSSYDVEYGLAAGRAQVRALQALAQSMNLPEETIQTIIDNAVFFIPQLIQE